MIGFGCTVGWLSLAIPLPRSMESPLKTDPISLDELSWIGSVISFGAFVGNILFGYLVTLAGSRHCIFFIGFPQLVSTCTRLI